MLDPLPQTTHDQTLNCSRLVFVLQWYNDHDDHSSFSWKDICMGLTQNGVPFNIQKKGVGVIIVGLAPSQSKSNWFKRRWWLACWSRAGTRSASKNPTCFHRWSPWLTSWLLTSNRPLCCATTKLSFWSTTHPVTYSSLCCDSLSLTLLHPQ